MESSEYFSWEFSSDVLFRTQNSTSSPCLAKNNRFSSTMKKKSRWTLPRLVIVHCSSYYLPPQCIKHCTSIVYLSSIKRVLDKNLDLRKNTIIIFHLMEHSSPTKLTMLRAIVIETIIRPEYTKYTRHTKYQIIVFMFYPTFGFSAFDDNDPQTMRHHANRARFLFRFFCSKNTTLTNYLEPS